jgi:hypothetical protein
MLGPGDGHALISLADGRQRKSRERYVLDADGRYVRARVTRARSAIRVEVPCVARPVTAEEAAIRATSSPGSPDHGNPAAADPDVILG